MNSPYEFKRSQACRFVRDGGIVEKRDEARDRRAIRVAIDSGHGPIYGNTANVSAHGMRVVLHNKRVLNPGQHVKVTVSKAGKHYQLTGEIRWFRFEILKNSLGLQFEEINDQFCLDILGVAPVGTEDHPYEKSFENLKLLHDEYQNNLRYGGLFVPCDDSPPPLNQNVWVELKLGDQGFRQQARVVIHQVGGFGVMFADINDVQSKIAKFFN